MRQPVETALAQLNLARVINDKFSHIVYLTLYLDCRTEHSDMHITFSFEWSALSQMNGLQNYSFSVSIRKSGEPIILDPVGCSTLHHLWAVALICLLKYLLFLVCFWFLTLPTCFGRSIILFLIFSFKLSETFVDIYVYRSGNMSWCMSLNYHREHCSSNLWESPQGLSTLRLQRWHNHVNTTKPLWYPFSLWKPAFFYLKRHSKFHFKIQDVISKLYLCGTCFIDARLRTNLQ